MCFCMCRAESRSTRLCFSCRVLRSVSTYGSVQSRATPSSGSDSQPTTRATAVTSHASAHGSDSGTCTDM